METYTVYILHSPKYDKYYIGQTYKIGELSNFNFPTKSLKYVGLQISRIPSSLMNRTTSSFMPSKETESILNFSNSVICSVVIESPFQSPVSFALRRKGDSITTE